MRSASFVGCVRFIGSADASTGGARASRPKTDAPNARDARKSVNLRASSTRSRCESASWLVRLSAKFAEAIALRSASSLVLVLSCSRASRLRTYGNRRSNRFMNCLCLVWAAGFEPATPCAQGRCATRLRYAQTGRDCGTPLPLRPIRISHCSCGCPVEVLDDISINSANPLENESHERVNVDQEVNQVKAHSWASSSAASSSGVSLASSSSQKSSQPSSASTVNECLSHLPLML